MTAPILLLRQMAENTDLFNLCYVVGIGLILLGLICLLRWFFKEH